MKKIVLASKSPRRSELLERLNLQFEIIVSQIDEESFEQTSPDEFVKTLAFEKADSVSKITEKDALVIGCDTVVVLDDEILGKPRDKAMAYDYLRRLSGNKHLVYSGIAIIDGMMDNTFISHEVTEVYMKELSDEEINAYIKTGEPLDKAGAYGIQGVGSIFIEKIVGDYYNVMGLPLNKFYKGLNELGVNYFKIVK